MCGRYVAVADRSVLSAEFAATPVGGKELAPDYNVSPSKNVYAVLQRGDQRQLRVLTWGLVPSWAKDPKIGNRLVNARLETADAKPSFRRAWAARRAVLPANGYYEWYTTSQVNPKGKPLKQPFYIHPSDNGLMAMAGLYEIWRDQDVANDDDPRAFRWTCTILTTNATDALGRIHDRMPLLVGKENLAQWLDPQVAQPGLDLLSPASPDSLAAYPVSSRVNRVANNDAELLTPLPAEDTLR